MADYQNLSAPQLNQINGSSSALGEGTFKRRDELRRAESLQRNKIKMGERTDRNLARAANKGDSATVSALLAYKKALGSGLAQTPIGIGSSADREERVQDGTIKGADARYKIGNIGNTNPADGPIANAPPPVEKSQGGDPAWDADNSGIPDSIQRPVAGPQTAPEAASAPSTSLSAALTPKALKSRQEFAADLDRSTLVQTDLAARERAYKRGESIGVSREEVDRRQQWSKPVLASEFSVAPEPNSVAVASESPSSFESLTQGAPKRKKDSPLVAAYNQKDKPSGLSRESVFGPSGSKSKSSRLAPKEIGNPTSTPINNAGIAGSVGRFAGNNLNLAKKYYGGVLNTAVKSAGAIGGKSADIASRYYGGLWNGVINSGASFLDESIKAYNSPPKKTFPR